MPIHPANDLAAGHGPRLKEIPAPVVLLWAARAEILAATCRSKPPKNYSDVIDFGVPVTLSSGGVAPRAVPAELSANQEDRRRTVAPRKRQTCKASAISSLSCGAVPTRVASIALVTRYLTVLRCRVRIWAVRTWLSLVV